MRRATLFCCVVGLGLSVAAVSALAHHSFSAEFDANKPLKVTGTVTKLEWQNPHTWFYVDVKDDGGRRSELGLRAREPEPPAAQRLDSLVDEGRRRRDRRGIPSEERQQYRECARRHVGGDGQDVAHGLEQRE